MVLNRILNFANKLGPNNGSSRTNIESSIKAGDPSNGGHRTRSRFKRAKKGGKIGERSAGTLEFSVFFFHPSISLLFHGGDLARFQPGAKSAVGTHRCEKKTLKQKERGKTRHKANSWRKGNLCRRAEGKILDGWREFSRYENEGSANGTSPA